MECVFAQAGGPASSSTRRRTWRLSQHSACCSPRCAAQTRGASGCSYSLLVQLVRISCSCMAQGRSKRWGRGRRHRGDARVAVRVRGCVGHGWRRGRVASRLPPRGGGEAAGSAGRDAGHHAPCHATRASQPPSPARTGGRAEERPKCARLPPWPWHLVPRLGTADARGLGRALARTGAEGAVAGRTGECGHAGDCAWGGSEAVQGDAEGRAGVRAEVGPRHSGAAGTESWAEGRKRRREGAGLAVRGEEGGTVMQERWQAASRMDSEADPRLSEWAELAGTGGGRAGNTSETRRMLPMRQGEGVGTEETAVAADVVPTSLSRPG